MALIQMESLEDAVAALIVSTINKYDIDTPRSRMHYMAKVIYPIS